MNAPKIVITGELKPRPAKISGILTQIDKVCQDLKSGFCYLRITIQTKKGETGHIDRFFTCAVDSWGLSILTDKLRSGIEYDPENIAQPITFPDETITKVIQCQLEILDFSHEPPQLETLDREIIGRIDEAERQGEFPCFRVVEEKNKSDEGAADVIHIVFDTVAISFKDAQDLKGRRAKFLPQGKKILILSEKNS